MLDKLIIFLISPLGSSLAVGMVALLAGLGRKRVLSVVLMSLSLGWILVWSLPVVSHKVAHQVEFTFPPQSIVDMPSASLIVVLGGGLSGTALIDSTGQNLNLLAAADRVWYAAELFKAGKAPLILASGGGYQVGIEMKEADAMAEFLVDLGVPPAVILKERESKNTRENAANSAKVLREMGVNRVILVTSALHMPRAVTRFEAQGIKVIPAPTDYESVSIGAGFDYIPSAAALEASGRAIKETVLNILLVNPQMRKVLD